MAKCVIIKCKMIAQPIEMPCSKTNCRYFADCLATYEEYLGTGKPQTNADRIRAMSDEELKDSILAVHLGYNPWCDYHCENKGDDGCDKCIEKWLKQPADDTK